MNRTIATAITSLVLLAAASPAASAAIFRAELGADGSACTQADPCGTIAAAVTAARAATGPDTIEIGPGQWAEPIQLNAAADAGNTVVGGGSGADAATNTIVRMAGSHVTLGSAPDITLSRLRLSVPHEWSAGTALHVSSDGALLEDVVVEGTMDSQPAVVISADATLDRVEVSVFDGSALETSGDAAVTVRDSSLALRALDPVWNRPGVSALSTGELRVVRSSIVAADASYAALHAGGPLHVDSSLVAGGWSSAVRHSSSDGDATILNSTIDAGVKGVADTEPIEPFGVIASAIIEIDARDVAVRSSIALERSLVLHSGGRIACSHSAVPIQVEPANPAEGNGQIACGAGGANRQVADPGALFRDALMLDYRLRTGSPAIDAGDPAALTAAESTTDRLGRPRVAQPRPDCAGPSPRRDQGAYESDAGCVPPGSGDNGTGNGGGGKGGGHGGGGGKSPHGSTDRTAPVLTRLALSPPRAGWRRIPKLRLRLSEPALIEVELRRGRRLVAAGSARLAAGRRSVALRRLLRRRGLPPGAYRLVVRATDAAGNRSEPRRLRMRSRGSRR